MPGSAVSRKTAPMLSAAGFTPPQIASTISVAGAPTIVTKPEYAGVAPSRPLIPSRSSAT
jgi:hypothetical protein